MLKTMLRGSWEIMLRPSVVNFEDHERNALGWALLYVALGALITALIGWLAFPIQQPFLERQYTSLSDEFARVSADVGQELPFETLAAPEDVEIPVIGNALSTLMGFLVYLGIIFVLGRALGGTGKIGELAYDISLFWVPVSVVSAVISAFSIGLFSCLTAPVIIFVTAYGFYLTFLSVQAGMNLLPNKALILILIPALLWLFIICVVVLLFAAVAAQGLA